MDGPADPSHESVAATSVIDPSVSLVQHVPVTPYVWVHGTASFPLVLRAHGGVVCRVCGQELGLSISGLNDHLRQHPFPEGMARREALKVVDTSLRQHALEVFRVAGVGGLLCDACNDTLILAGAAIQNHLRHKHSHRADLNMCDALASRLSRVPPASIDSAQFAGALVLVLPCPSFLSCGYVSSVESDANARIRLRFHINSVHVLDGLDVKSICSDARVVQGLRAGSKWMLQPGEAFDSLGLRPLPLKGQVSAPSVGPQVPVAAFTAHHGNVVGTGALVPFPPTALVQSTITQTAAASVEAGAFGTIFRGSSFRDEVPQFDSRVHTEHSALSRLAERHLRVEEHDPLLMLGKDVAASASALFLHFGWWTEPWFYREIAPEGAMVWYSLCNDDVVQGGVSDTWVAQAARHFVDISCSIAATCLASNPSIGANLLRMFDDPAGQGDGQQVDGTADQGHPSQGRLTVLQERSRVAYSATLAKFLRFLQNRASRDSKDLPFPGTLQHSSDAGMFTCVQEVVYTVEWGAYVSRVPKLSLMGQFYAGSALQPREGVLGPTSAAHLKLTVEGAMSHTASHLLWVQKACLLNFRASAVENRGDDATDLSAFISHRLSTSRSSGILASSKSFVTKGREIAPDGAVSVSLGESGRRAGAPVCVVLSPSGTYYLGTLELLAGVGDAVVKWLTLLREILTMLGVDEGVKAALLSPDSGQILFKPHRSDLSDWAWAGDRDGGVHLGACAASGAELLSPEGKRRLFNLLGQAEHYLMWRLHVLAGGLSRAADIGLLSYYGATDRVNVIEAVSEHELRITALNHKTAWRGRYTVERYPDILTSQMIGAWISLKASLFGDVKGTGPMFLWRPVTVQGYEREVTVAFAATSLSLLRFSLSFSQFRQVMAKLVFEGRESIEYHALKRRGEGQPPECKLQKTPGCKYANLITLGFGHTLETSEREYGMGRVTSEDYGSGCFAYQRFIGIPELVPRHRDVQDRGNDASLLGGLHMNDAAVTASLLECVGRVYGSTNPAFHSAAQQQALTLFVHQAKHVISIAGCASGKSSLYLVPSLLAGERGTVVILLCPQRNVSQSAALLAKGANISYWQFRGSEEDTRRVEGMQGLTLRGPRRPGVQRLPGFSLVITTFDVISQAPAFLMLIDTLLRVDRLDSVVVDEPQINLSAFSWRSCFHAAGAVQSIVGNKVRVALTTATLPAEAIDAFKDFFRIQGDTAVVWGDCGYPRGLQFIVEEVDRAEDRVFQILETSGTQDGKWPRRTLILMLTTSGAERMSNRLGSEFPGVNVGVITGDSSIAQMNIVLTSSTIICSTTAIGASDNIPRLDQVIVVSSQYSLGTVVQTAGRAARSPDTKGIAYLLFSKKDHNEAFGRPGSNRAVEERLKALAWAGSYSMNESIRRAFTSAGVRHFAESRVCRRAYLLDAFGEGVTESRTCIQDSLALCDVCAGLTEGNSEDAGPLHVDESGVDVSGNVGDEHEEVLAPQEVDDMADEIPEELLVGMELDRDVILAVGPIADPSALDSEGGSCGPVQGVQCATKNYGTTLLSTLQTAIGRLSEMSDKMQAIRCWVCMNVDCNGFRGDGHGPRGRSTCNKRTYLAGQIVCFGCGSGEHNRDACDFRKQNERPRIPQDKERCYECFLPMGVCLGISFHVGGKNPLECKALGDRLFVVLSLLYWTGDSQTWAALESTCGDLFSSPAPRPPAKGSRSASGGATFASWWQWLFGRSKLHGGVLNLDVVLSHALRDL